MAKTKRPEVRVKRVYEDASSQDGRRVLVDRVWPRGLSKDRAKLDLWCKAVAPSTPLRKWYRHDPEKFAEFTRRYRLELDEPEAASALADLAATEGPLTLLTASAAVEISQAKVLATILESGSRA